jgi:hypothetical protein
MQRTSHGPLFGGIVNRWSFPGALLLAAYFLASSIYISYHRLFWYDEVFTTLTTRLPDWHTIWRALVEENADPSPFGFFVIARIFDKLFGPGEIGLRLPSALAMSAGMLITYDCVRRVADSLHGLIAMAVVGCSFLPYYGYEGRCYALLFLFASAVCWAWIGNRSALLLFALFSCGVLIHYYLVLCLVPLVMDEAWGWRPWKRPSARIVACILGSFVGIAVLSPQILASRRVHAGKWWTLINTRQIPVVLTDIFPAGLFLLAMATVWIAWSVPRKPIVVAPVSTAELVGWSFLLTLVAGYVGARLVTHAFLNRYFIGMIPGVAIAFSCSVWRRFPGITRIPVGILVLLAGYGIANQAAYMMQVEEIPAYGPAQTRTRAILAMEDQLSSQGKSYIVFDDGDLRFLEARYYSKHPERYALWKDEMPPPSRYYPMQVWTVEEIKRHSREAAFLDLPARRLELLQRSGFRTLLSRHDLLMITLLE